jgi:hypothetical protein
MLYAAPQSSTTEHETIDSQHIAFYIKDNCSDQAVIAKAITYFHNQALRALPTNFLNLALRAPDSGKIELVCALR